MQNLPIAKSHARFIALLTAQRIFAIKLRRAKIHATISQNYLLGGACFARKRKIQIFLNCGNAAISLAHSANFTVRKDNYTHA